ncbi:MAG: hypothetical protein IJG33_10240 [Selenomonadaceae bacterium]|nr:hypothetical protein [Selenomonadaceae bacterium]MBQ3443610.1 hypothetical protein [Selenomonadaceae bacterium]
MGEMVVYKGMKISPEQQKRILEIKELKDDEIDYSDIPPLTDEELAKMKPARLRRQKNKLAS